MARTKTRLAIDPGSECGWAIRPNQVYAVGTWNLTKGSGEGAGMRYLRLRKLLERLAEEYTITEVAYEKIVRTHKGTAAAHVYGGIVAVLTAWCEEMKIPYQAIQHARIKKFATDNGNASKDMMVEAARREFPHVSIEDHNQADALWLLRFMETL